MDEKKLVCPFCGAHMTLRHSGYLMLREKKFTSEEFLAAELYLCPTCRYLAWFAPPTPIENFEEEKRLLEKTQNPVKRFEILFADYSVKQLQKVINGRDYLPEAKEAAQKLLSKKGE